MSPLFSTRAGRAFRREGTTFVDADPAKGTLSLELGDEDLLYLRWRARDGSTSMREDLDLVLLPSDASLEKISDDPAVRMYVLKFQSSDQLHFVSGSLIGISAKMLFDLGPESRQFWLQGPDSSQDANVVRRINELITETSLEVPSINEGGVENLAPTEGTTTNQPSGAAPAGPLNPEQLNSFVQELMRGLQGNRAGVAPDLSLTDILTPAVLSPILQDPLVVESLAPFLPTDLLSPSSPVADMPRQEMLRQTVGSAPFRASVRSLDQALSTGLLGGLVVNLGMPMEAGLGVHPFLDAIRAQAAERNQSEQGDKDDHQMDTQ